MTFVDDEDATQKLVDGERTLRQLLSHQGAFKLDSGAIHLFCYPYGLTAFWPEPDDTGLAALRQPGVRKSGRRLRILRVQLLAGWSLPREPDSVSLFRIFSSIGSSMRRECAPPCSTDIARRIRRSVSGAAVSHRVDVMHVGPYINLVSPTDELCEDNFYSSEDLYGDPYSWQFYHLDEAAAEPRDPAGGVIASVIDLAHFAEALLASYHGSGGLLSSAGIRELWEARSDLGCYPNCPYERYYGIGFFTDSLPGGPINQVGHGGSRAGYASAFVIRPEGNRAVCILANADASTVALSDLAKTILDDFEAAELAADFDLDGDIDSADAIMFASSLFSVGNLSDGGQLEVQFSGDQVDHRGQVAG